jgi:gas vesicle protein
MLVFIIGLVIGIIVGAAAAVLVARNNRAKAERVFLQADKVSERYKDYMTKWNDKTEGENKN